MDDWGRIRTRRGCVGLTVLLALVLCENAQTIKSQQGKDVQITSFEIEDLAKTLPPLKRPRKRVAVLDFGANSGYIGGVNAGQAATGGLIDALKRAIEEQNPQQTDLANTSTVVKDKYSVAGMTLGTIQPEQRT